MEHLKFFDECWELSGEESENELEIINFNKKKELTTREKKVTDLLLHQNSAQMSYTKTELTAKFFNSDSSVFLPETKYKIKKSAKELRQKTYNLQCFKLFRCGKCKELFEVDCTCGYINKNKSAFMFYFPIEQQIRQSLNKNFKEILNFLSREKKSGIGITR